MANKAYQITTSADEGFGIYSARTAGKAKTMAVTALQDAYPKANYSWITSCRRNPEYDELAMKYPGCIAWEHNGEHWQQDKGRWWDGQESFFDAVRNDTEMSQEQKDFWLSKEPKE